VQVPVYNISGEEVEKIDISDHVFGVPFNMAVVHQVMLAQRANARQGTASTKTRGDVIGSNRKLYRQKGTGNARPGDIKSPLRRGGGIIVGPKPRNYRQSIPKKMRRLALRCVLSDKVRQEEMLILNHLELEQPKTRDMVNVLTALKIDTSSLIVTDKPDENLVKSARNIPGIKTMPVNLLNVIDLLSHKKIIMTVPAIRMAETIWEQNLPDGGSDAHSRGVAASVDN
jgi:large subunit ribosomal protein L4